MIYDYKISDSKIYSNTIVITEIISGNDKGNYFYLNDFIKQSASINYKNSESFNRTKKWLIENHPELLI